MKFIVNHDVDHFSFVLTTDSGEVLANSLNFPSREGCLEAVRGLTDELPNAVTYRETGNSFSLVINHLTIANSPEFATPAAARLAMEELMADASNETKYDVEFSTLSDNFVIDVDVPKTSSVNQLHQDNYLPCEAYANHTESSAEGFRTFAVSGEHYFAMVNPDGDVLLRSEAYPTTAVRDNGLASVQKNREIKERYSVIEDDGEYVVVLKAANYKEIARSCGYADRSALMMLFPFLDARHGGGFPWEIVGISASSASIQSVTITDDKPTVDSFESETPVSEAVPSDPLPFFETETESGEVDSEMTGLAAAIGGAALAAGAVADTDDIEIEPIKVVSGKFRSQDTYANDLDDTSNILATKGGIPRWMWALLGAVLLAALLWWVLRGSTGGGEEIPYKDTTGQLLISTFFA